MVDKMIGLLGRAIASSANSLGTCLELAVQMLS